MNLRKNFLKKELSDFVNLLDKKFLKNLEDHLEITKSRFELEQRNSFNSSLYKEFNDCITTTESLILFIKSNENFYRSRIKEISQELRDIYENEENSK